MFLSPWLLGFFGLTAGPMLVSLYLAFTDYNLFNPPQWVGLDNFVELFHDPQYLQSVGVTLTYVVIGTPLKLASALGVAMLLNRSSRVQGFYRSALYVPSLLGASVSIAIVWKAMFSNGGVVDEILSAVGIHLGGWVGSVTLAMPMMIILACWQFGAPMVIFLAGLKQIPGELYEAASLDGAGAFRKFIGVTLPMLGPVLLFNLILDTIGSFQIFAPAYIISGGQGGPAGATMFYTLYLYIQGFTDFRMGYASAMAWLLVVVLGIVTYLFFRSSKSWANYTGGEE
ncbi:carbohydrate ABC transporter permease [Compostimonas suwonensis]|uniref:carbohydrate ABC transporter permease n=1 Tax=Compostimonas suwonensis TaxID=1048394 RepID=UPI001FE53394|nr:sugar ABC transporter permease [Compostimonas suwonensis]